ncbi:hypothetical protein RND81_10G242500 [Saponaria officinalis]|uniref:C2H2-type domain-containing protein n=1 Tax=Saponaria officinalis TaxID=3572 RepID=A0AAW1I815_SAPOF
MSFNIQELDHHLLQNRAVVDVENQGIRSYDCVFCRRGFTTAQALGGHMNIHRKDRASTTMNKPINNSTVDKSKEMLLEDDNNNDNDNDQVNTTTKLFFSPKSYLSYDQCHSNGGKSGFEGRSSLLSRVQDHGHGHGHHEEEVDLELRLGHYPW